MEKKLLTICIPTYNNKYVLEKEVNDYLSLKDDRIVIKINDNASSDGTDVCINSLIKEYGDIVYQRNTTNVGQYYNAVSVISNVTSEYLLFVLDKDLIDIKELPAFLEFLSSQKPSFGYVDLSITKANTNNVYYRSGIDGVLAMAYQNKHPSGFFYKTDIINQALKRESFLKIENMFEFLFDVLNGEIAANNNSVIYNRPLVITENLRDDIKSIPHSKKSLTYNESNIWYSSRRRLVAFHYYLDNALSLNLPLHDRKIIAKWLFNRACGDVSTGLRALMLNQIACEHYNLKIRKVPLSEMISNIKEVYKTFLDICKEKGISFNISDKQSIHLILLKRGLRCLI